MKRHHKHSLLFILGVLIVGGALSLFIALRPDSAGAPIQSGETRKQPNKTPPPEPTPITLSLPGTKPITAVIEDYTQPSSTWVVVSKDHPLGNQSYRPKDLAMPPTSVATNTQKSTDEQSLRQTIFEPTVALFDAAKKSGFDLFVASGFRSYELQKTYFDNYARTSGEAAANMYSAHPGQSEHQTGIAFDISLVSRECYLETCFGETTAGKWLAEHAYEYGFILRYPADKTEITKYQYEPWHFRYVGIDLARALHESKLTLDEAYPYMQKALEELKKQKLVSYVTQH